MTLRWVKMAACAVICTVPLVTGCASRNQVTLQMERKIVPVDPEIQGMTIDPIGVVDTRDRGHTVQFEMAGDPGLEATFDVVGRIRGQPMEEIRPGVYLGSFEIQQGETGTFAFVGQLRHPPTDATARSESPERLQAIRSPDPPACSAVLKRDLHERLEALTVYFESDKFALTDDAKGKLAARKGLFTDEKYAPCDIHIHGYSDERGSTGYNLELSRHRAMEVQWYLYSLGVDRSRLDVNFFGEERPAALGRSPAALAKNRRVEVVAIDAQ